MVALLAGASGWVVCYARAEAVTQEPGEEHPVCRSSIDSVFSLP